MNFCIETDKDIRGLFSGKSDKLIFGLLFFSLLSYLVTMAGNFMFKKELLPLGYKYVVLKEGEPSKGTISVPTEKVFKSVERNSLKALILITEPVLMKNGVYGIRVWNYRKATLNINGKVIYLEANRLFTPINLEKGTNRIKLIYNLKKYEGGRLGVELNRGDFSDIIPGHLLTIPDNLISSSISWSLSFVRVLRDYGFVVSIFILIFKITLLFSKSSIGRSYSPEGSITPGFMTYSNFISFFGLLIGMVFLNQRLRIFLPDKALIVFSMVILIGGFIFKSRVLAFKKEDLHYIVALILISVTVIGGVWLLSGRLMPFEPIGDGDLPAHIEMVDHYSRYMEFKKDQERMIYPQALHGLLSILSSFTGYSIVNLITPFILIVLILSYFSAYCLFRHFSPDSGWFVFIVAILVSNPIFIYETLFRYYYFPQIVSILFFFNAILNLIKKRIIFSSISVATSVIIYPYFAPFIFFTLFFTLLIITKSDTSRMMAVFYKLTSFFVYPLVLFIIYVYIYLSFGFPQINEGYSTIVKLNPISALNPLWVFIFILSLFINLKRGFETLATLLGASIMAFCCYYIPYLFLNIGTTYYMTKLMFLISLLGVVTLPMSLKSIYSLLKEKVVGK